MPLEEVGEGPVRRVEGGWAGGTAWDVPRPLSESVRFYQVLKNTKINKRSFFVLGMDDGKESPFFFAPSLPSHVLWTSVGLQQDVSVHTGLDDAFKRLHPK